MHNIEVLVKGKPRCTLQVHPDDAAALGLVDGGRRRVTSRSGSSTVPVEVTDAIRAGRGEPPARLGPRRRRAPAWRVAADTPGVNSNLLADDAALDPLSGTSVLNGIPVTVAALAG